jgi:Putative DNA-binding domain
MIFHRDKLLALAAVAMKEARQLDFKREWDLGSAASWCEVIKDVAALANSGGGVIVFGVEDDGRASGADGGPIFALDQADITNRMFKYTNHQFADFEIARVERGGVELPALIVAPSDVPIVFTKPGTYDVGEGKQKTAFAQGTVYFRHGAKSEPGNRDDLARWRDRELTKHRRSLMQGMRKVVEAPPDHSVVVVPAGVVKSTDLATVAARITTDPSAAKVAVHNTDALWPYRQKEFLKIVQPRLPKGVRVGPYDLQCVNQRIKVLADHPEFAHKPHKLASPQYNDAYADWLVAQAVANPKYFEECRREHHQPKQKK